MSWRSSRRSLCTDPASGERLPIGRFSMFSEFRVHVSDAVLADLRSRLARSRFTTRSGAQPWQGGSDTDHLRELVTYWADGFDWRAREAELNAFPHHQATIAGRAVHFVHLPGDG